jgi:hypothetical protein
MEVSSLNKHLELDIVMKVIRYTKGNYKYQLADHGVKVQTRIHPPLPIVTEYIILTPRGELLISYGYAWDGPSGPTIDTKSFMRGSLFHDALYQLMRTGKLDRSWKDAADRLLQEVCIEDGMFKLRAWWVYQGVRIGGKASAHPDNQRMVYTAP